VSGPALTDAQEALLARHLVPSNGPPEALASIIRELERKERITREEEASSSISRLVRLINRLPDLRRMERRADDGLRAAGRNEYERGRFERKLDAIDRQVAALDEEIATWPDDCLEALLAARPELAAIYFDLT
jgi:hypothetical protein